GVDLERRELLVLLVDQRLQVLVTRPQAVRFALQGIVVRHLSDHAGVAGDQSEEREESEESKGENRVDRLMGNVDSTKATPQGVGQHHNEILLFHSLSGWNSRFRTSNRDPSRGYFILQNWRRVTVTRPGRLVKLFHRLQPIENNDIVTT